MFEQKVYNWVLGLLAALLVSAAGGSFGYAFNLESRVTAVEVQNIEVLRRLNRIEQMLDDRLPGPVR